MLRILLLVVLLPGCTSNPKWLENRAVCTVDGTEFHFISKYGPIEFGSEIAEEDAKAVCGKLRIKAS